MTNISLILTFSAGLASFLSPCVLPLVPAYVGYITDSATQNQSAEKSKLYVLYRALSFVVGFSVIFIVMGASITSLGKIFIKNQSVFKKIAGFLVIIFGLHMTGIFKIKLLYYEKKFLSFKSTNSALGAVFMGMAFAAGWTPCVINNNKYYFKVLLDSNNTTAEKYHISSIPTSYFFDKDGNIVDKHIGSMTINDMKNYIDKLNY